MHPPSPSGPIFFDAGAISLYQVQYVFFGAGWTFLEAVFLTARALVLCRAHAGSTSFASTRGGHKNAQGFRQSTAARSSGAVQSEARSAKRKNGIYTASRGVWSKNQAAC